MLRARKNIIIYSIAAALVLTAIIFPVGAALGWFRLDKKAEGGDTDIKPYSIALNVWFDDGTTTPKYLTTAERENLDVELTDATSAKYFGKLRVQAVYNGSFDALLRVRVLHFWKQGGETPSVSAVKYSSGTNVLDNSKSDNGYYYCDKTMYPTLIDDKTPAFTLSPSSPQKTFDIITGLNQTIRYEKGLTLSLMIYGELIPPNRVEEFWGSLPIFTV